MKRFLIAEARFDAIVLRTLFSAAGLEEIQILEGGGRSAAISLGTSLALNGVGKVAIVVDADTVDIRRLQEQQSIFEDLQYHGRGGETCKLFLAVPTLEGDLFPTAQDFSSTFNIKLTERQLQRYEKDWKLVIRSLLTAPEAGRETKIRIGKVSQPELEKIFSKPLLAGLKDYLRTEHA